MPNCVIPGIFEHSRALLIIVSKLKLLIFGLSHVTRSSSLYFGGAGPISLFQTVLPGRAFFGRGPKVGPRIIMTDDAASERNAILNIWPAVVLMLCVFHLLQAYWRWLWNADNKIAKMDRPTRFNLFKLVVYAPNEELHKEKEGLLNHATVAKYPKLLNTLEKTFYQERRSGHWRLVLRKIILPTT